MKTKLLQLSALAVFFAVGVQAQYFQRMYGTGGSESLEGGIAVGALPQGYAMTGFSSSAAAVFNTVMVTRTDASGVVGGAPLFNNFYPMFNTANQLSARGRRMIEAGPSTTTGQFAVFGDYDNPAADAPGGFFYMLLNGNGTVPAGMPRSYTLPFTSALYSAEATSITPSVANPSLVYVCGNVKLGSNLVVPMVMCLQASTGNIVWGFIYQTPSASTSLEWTATDLVESPYPSTGTSPNVVVVGRYDVSGTGNGDGCLFMLDGGTGAPTSYLYTYGSTLVDDGFNSITVASNPVGSGAGFAMAGYTQNPIGPAVLTDSWALKVSADGSVVDWSSILRYSTGANDFANDIIERLNTAGNWEYYVGGTTANGVFGGSDQVVYKLDGNGIAVAGGQFTYGGQGDENAMQLAQRTNGLSVFGSTNGSFAGLGGSDFYNVKTYFNGVTACNFQRQTIPTVTGPDILAKEKPDTWQPLIAGSLSVQVTPVNQAVICFANIVFGGSNARMGHEDEYASEETPATLFPNPVNAGDAHITLTFDEPVAAGDAELELWNTLGQLCMHQTVALADGATRAEVELGNNLAPGIYHFIIRHNGKMQDFKVSVQ